MRFLLKSGADVAPFDDAGSTPLHWHQNTDISTSCKIYLSAVLDAGMDVHAGNHDSLLRSEGGHAETSLTLMEHGADVNSMVGHRYT